MIPATTKKPQTVTAIIITVVVSLIYCLLGGNKSVDVGLGKRIHPSKKVKSWK